MSDFEGLCESTYFDRMYYGQDHWHGSRRIKGKQVAWNHVSPSQIESFQKCKRSWFFKSILKIPEGQRGHQSLGEAFHLVMEKVPQGLSWPDHADVGASKEDWAKAEALAKLALPLLPEDPGHAFKREWGIRLDTYEGGPTMVGYLDLGIPVGHGWPAFFVPNNEAIVVDYKTLSDFRYMRTPQELASSVQMMTYAKWAIEPWPTGLHGENLSSPEHVRLLHMYAKTRPPFTRSSIRHESAIVTPQDINLQWTKTLDTIHEMDHIASGCTNADQVDATGAITGHCEAYGGCYFRDKCGLSPNAGIKTLFQISKKPQASQTPTTTEPVIMSSVLEKIKAARAKEEAAKAATGAQTASVSAPSGTADNSASNSVAPVASVVNQSNQPTENEVKGPISGLLAKIQAQGKGTPTLGGAIAGAYGKEIGSQAAGFAGTAELGKSTVSTMGELLKLASGVVPPDAPSRSQEVITHPGDQVQNEQPQGESEDDEDESVESDESGIPVSGNVPTDSGNNPSASEPVKKRGRPTNAEIEARKAEEAKRFQAAVDAAVAKKLSEIDTTPIASDDLAGQLKQAKLEAEAERAIAEQRKDDNRKLHAECQSLGRRNAELVAQAGSAPLDGLTLYVDCYPTKGDTVVDYYEWIGPICAQVAGANAVGDWREIQYTAKAMLANAIRATLKDGNNLPRAMYVSSSASGSEIALEVLTPIAKRVIRRM